MEGNTPIEKQIKIPKKNGKPLELRMIYTKKITPIFDINRIKRTVELFDNNGNFQGDFSIDGDSIGKGDECFDTGNTCCMKIFLEDELQGLGLTRVMMRFMIENIYRDYPNIRRDQILAIGGDGSGGFWDKIGMYDHRYGYDRSTPRDIEGAGYEKIITFQELENFAFPFHKGGKSGGGKGRKTRKSRKHKRVRRFKTKRRYRK